MSSCVRAPRTMYYAPRTTNQCRHALHSRHHLSSAGPVRSNLLIPVLAKSEAAHVVQLSAEQTYAAARSATHEKEVVSSSVTSTLVSGIPRRVGEGPIGDRKDAVNPTGTQPSPSQLPSISQEPQTSYVLQVLLFLSSEHGQCTMYVANDRKAHFRLATAQEIESMGSGVYRALASRILSPHHATQEVVGSVLGVSSL